MYKKINLKLINTVILIVLIIFTSIATVYAEKIIASKSVTYNNQVGWLDSNSVHNAVDELYEYCIKSETFAEYLMSLSASSTVIADDGTADHSMRYTGKSPNNYITFAGETWRVIGAINNVDDGTGKKETRVKIIKESSIGNLTWHTSTTNVWKNASLNSKLQALTYASNSNVENAVWYLGDAGGDLPVTKTAYQKERTTVASGNSITWTGKVGMMTPSDYGFGSSSCWNGAQMLENYHVSACATTNWLLLGSLEWLINPRSDSTTNARYIRADGHIGSTATTNTGAVRPTVYLKSNVWCKNCNESDAGTKQNPFQLS